VPGGSGLSDPTGTLALPTEIRPVRASADPGNRGWEWQAQAACRSADAGLFFHPDDDRGPVRAAREAAAKAVCRRCRVLEDCARYALASGERFGVWGGMTEAERTRITTEAQADGARSGAPSLVERAS
jgi:WhiB family transcriptional regulator, redox-sensing transcriptional regulator